MKNNWLTLKSLFLCVSALSASGLILSGCTENANLNVGEWSLEYDAHANGIDISKGSKLIYDNVYAAYKLADSVVSTRDYAKHHVSTKKINDHFGEGYHYEVTYTGNNLPVLVQSFYVYPAKDYVLDALKAGKQVVTANKDLIAEYGEEVGNAANKAGADLQSEWNGSASRWS